MDHPGNNNFNTTVASLEAQGFAYNFSFSNDEVICTQMQLSLCCHECNTIEMHFYPGEDRTATEKMLYAISAPRHAIKGLLVIDGVSDIILFLDMMKRKDKCNTTATTISAQWKSLMTEDILY